MKVFHANHIHVDFPRDHHFPIAKYGLLQESIIQQGILRVEELIPAPLVHRETLLLAHSPEYVHAVLHGALEARISRQIGLPMSPEIVQRALASIGGTIAAAEEALNSGISGNLDGGTHHACADQGAGFCIFNDVAVAALHLFSIGAVTRIAVIDLDVHQGNGTASILNTRPDVYLLSIHGSKNYPYRKVPSTLDIGLPDGTKDAEYLAMLSGALPRVFSFYPDLVFYIAGADSLAEDRLGKLSLTMKGLARRDEMVLTTAYETEVPIVLLMGGGYAEHIERTVEAHAQTYRIARQIFKI